MYVYLNMWALVRLLWLFMSSEGGHCPNDQPKNCSCTFFSKRYIVDCMAIDNEQVPSGIPSNTVILNLAMTSLKDIREDDFENLTLLKKLDLSQNQLRYIPQNTFRNLPLLAVINLRDNFISGGFYLPKTVGRLDLLNNLLSSDDLKVILKGLTKLSYLDVDENKLGPVLSADVFAGSSRLDILSMNYCRLERIESGVFQSMKNLSDLNLKWNALTNIQALKGLEQLTVLRLRGNRISTIADRTFEGLKYLSTLDLGQNLLRSVPDLTGLVDVGVIRFDSNQIADITKLGKGGYIFIGRLDLSANRIDHLPPTAFENTYVRVVLDLSFNKLQSIPDNLFQGFHELSLLGLNFNSITHINRRSFAGLRNLGTLMMIHNNLTSIPDNVFVNTRLGSLYLHNNAIRSIGDKAFNGLHDLSTVTLFGNPLTLLPNGLLNALSSSAKVSITCKNLRQLSISHGRDAPVIDCAPSTTFHVLLNTEESINFRSGFERSGFVCQSCSRSCSNIKCCGNCSFCTTGFYSFNGSCKPCPAGGFYQDQMGQIECKKCSLGTYVSWERHPGTSATDCKACPYGTLSNETAGFRACRCLQGFYRLDRFGPCSECLADGINCDRDTATLARDYYWKWTNKNNSESYKNFVQNIRSYGPDYNKIYSKFIISLPKPVKCPYAGSCKGGIDSDCNEGYKGTLCASCRTGYYLRFNTCIKCPRFAVAILSTIFVTLCFVVVFLMVFWGDSKETDNNRTVADVIMSCFKIVIGFYQVISGIFTALARVKWPVTLIPMEKFLRVSEGNIFQFAPLSCIYSQMRLNAFSKFILVLSINFFVVFVILSYVFLKKRYIRNKKDCPDSEKIREVSSLKKSCYRNIFLFLLASYPMTSKTIIQIIPLPGACVTHCFTDDINQCIFLLKSDYSLHCFTAQHNMYWPVAGVFSVYPIGFPLLVLFLICKCRRSQFHEELTFGMKVFYENYKAKFWFWEITEMYRKLTLISFIFLFGSEGVTQIGLTLLVVSVFGVAYTFFRPIKSKFEDLLQTFVLWVIFFDVCLGAMYSTSDDTEGNDSLTINILFVVLNASILLVALGKGIAHASFFWKRLCSCLIHCFHFIRHWFRTAIECLHAHPRMFGLRSQSFDEQRQLCIQEFT